MEGVNGEYCRSVEAYLCRKNDGHLIRIAGPAFTRVCDWATRGIPLAVVYRGIDRYFERYYSRGPRRRPVQIDFCENDVLDVFDEWRRAVGAWTPPPPELAGPSTREGAAERSLPSTSPGEPRSAVEGPSPGRKSASLPAHLERVIVRLTRLRAGPQLAAAAHAAVDAAVRELDAARAGATHLRGPARDALIARLQALDCELVGAVRGSLSADEWQTIERDARQELAPFKGGLAEDAYSRAVEASAARLLRERTGLPVLEFES